MTDLFAALALAIVLEGLLYAAFPEHMKRFIATIIELPTARIRTFALIAAAIGLVLLGIVRS